MPRNADDPFFRMYDIAFVNDFHPVKTKAQEAQKAGKDNKYPIRQFFGIAELLL